MSGSNVTPGINIIPSNLINQSHIDYDIFKIRLDENETSFNPAIRGFILLVLIGSIGGYLMGPSWPILLLILYIVYYGPFIFNNLAHHNTTVQPFITSKEGFESSALSSGIPTGFIDSLQNKTPLTKLDTTTNPSPKNPFMNILLDEIQYNPNRLEAAPINDPVVKNTLNDFFQVQWTSDPTDVFGRSQGQRQFYTMPSSTIPNDRASYQNWLYLIPGKTCKEGGVSQCVPGTNGGAIPWLSKPN
jgi:hypothetical protein